MNWKLPERWRCAQFGDYRRLSRCTEGNHHKFRALVFLLRFLNSNSRVCMQVQCVQLQLTYLNEQRKKYRHNILIPIIIILLMLLQVYLLAIRILIFLSFLPLNLVSNTLHSRSVYSSSSSRFLSPYPVQIYFNLIIYFSTFIFFLLRLQHNAISYQFSRLLHLPFSFHTLQSSTVPSVLTFPCVFQSLLSTSALRIRQLAC